MMNLVVSGKPEGGAGFQGWGASFWRGWDWKVEGDFLLVTGLG